MAHFKSFSAGLAATFFIASGLATVVWSDPHGTLTDAAGRGDCLTATLALKAGADINFDFDAPLRMAAQNGQLAMVKWLVDHGANLHRNGRTALKMAAFRNQFEIVDFMMSRGADFIGGGAATPEAQYEYILRHLDKLGHIETANVVARHLESRGVRVNYIDFKNLIDLNNEKLAL